MFAQKSRGVQVRGSLYPHMILSDLGPRSNTCPDDWHFSLITGQPHNRKHLPELWLSVHSKPQAGVQVLYVNYPQQRVQQLLHTAPNLISCYLNCIYDFYVSFGIFLVFNLNSNVLIFLFPCLCQSDKVDHESSSKPEEPFGSVLLLEVELLHITEPLLWCSGPSHSAFSHFFSFLSAALLKVWCRQSKLNRVFNLFSPCQESLSCEITEQEPRRRSPFKNSHREHPSALAPASAFVLAASTELLNTNVETSGSIRLDLAEELLRHL